MQDKLGRSQALEGVLQPNETKRFAIAPSNGQNMKMGNHTGAIALLNAAKVQVALVTYDRGNSSYCTQWELFVLPPPPMKEESTHLHFRHTLLCYGSLQHKYHIN